MRSSAGSRAGSLVVLICLFTATYAANGDPAILAKIQDAQENVVKVCAAWVDALPDVTVPALGTDPRASEKDAHDKAAGVKSNLMELRECSRKYHNAMTNPSVSAQVKADVIHALAEEFPARVAAYVKLTASQAK